MKKLILLILMLMSFTLGYQYAIYQYTFENTNDTEKKTAPHARKDKVKREKSRQDSGLADIMADITNLTKDIAKGNFKQAEKTYADAKKKLDEMIEKADKKKSQILSEIREKLDSIKEDIASLNKYREFIRGKKDTD